MDANTAPVIIKRKKVVAGDGHHGGAWKVAYADFVTAMMAFFMLMWLLNATTEKQRKGIADYFSPTIPISRVSGGGDGMFGGDSVFSEMALPQNGTGATSLRPTEGNQARGAIPSDGQGAQPSASDQLDELQEALAGMSGEAILENPAMRHVETRLTDEGLVVEIFDLEGSTLFTDRDEPTELLFEIGEILGRVSNLVENDVAIEGHLRSGAVVLVDNQNWVQSVARANTLREILESTGFDETRFHRVTGHADRELVASNPMSVRNNRIELIYLRN